MKMGDGFANKEVIAVATNLMIITKCISEGAESSVSDQEVDDARKAVKASLQLSG